MALYFYTFISRTGKPGIYLKDLFVETAYRKKGYGRTLLRDLAKEVEKIGGNRGEWSCWDWNKEGLHFYEKETIEAKRKEESFWLKLDGDALEKLIESRGQGFAPSFRQTFPIRARHSLNPATPLRTP
jgi:ribosomal protein S18 acetylase RimI-like enzyme